jgi:phenylacetate-coenzyme A ligase PaaK-like adenylate-forming protein
VTIRHAFGAPVVIEYGLIEAGVVGYSRGETNTIQVLYDSFYCHADPTDGLILTTLWPRVFPLVNYDTNDKIVPKNEHDKSILSLARIVGRKHDVLNLVLGSGGNVAVHGEFFTHVMKNLEYVDSFRVQQRRSGREVKILVVVNERIHTEQISADIMTRITREFAVAPEYIKVEMVDSLDKTIAGKERWIEIID